MGWLGVGQISPSMGDRDLSDRDRALAVLPEAVDDSVVRRQHDGVYHNTQQFASTYGTRSACIVE